MSYRFEKIGETNREAFAAAFKRPGEAPRTATGKAGASGDGCEFLARVALRNEDELASTLFRRNACALHGTRPRSRAAPRQRVRLKLRKQSSSTGSETLKNRPTRSVTSGSNERSISAV